MEIAKAVEERLLRGISEKVFPGCAFAQVSPKGIQIKTFGNFTYESESPVVSADTIYDVASLTKVMAPMSILMQLVDEQVITLEMRLAAVLPEFTSTAFRSQVRVKHLLSYTVDFAVLGSSKDLRMGKTPEEFADTLALLDLRCAPGTSYCYSNVTAFWATLLIECVTGRSLPDLFSERIVQPLGLSEATFYPSLKDLLRIPPTEVRGGREVCGIAHDESTAFLAESGSTMGAAGLFATVEDVALFLQSTLGTATKNGVSLFSATTRASWIQNMFPEISFPTPCVWSDDQNARVLAIGPDLIHKGGFTGCFMCADVEKKIGFVILSNRTYPVRPANSDAFVSVWEDVAKVMFQH